jgi:hypothetical protein
VHGCEDSLGAQAQSAGEGINGSLAMDGGGGAALFWAKKEAKRGNDDNGRAFYRRLGEAWCAVSVRQCYSGLAQFKYFSKYSYCLDL